jgi:hypothetical protein
LFNGAFGGWKGTKNSKTGFKRKLRQSVKEGTNIITGPSIGFIPHL